MEDLKPTWQQVADGLQVAYSVILIGNRRDDRTGQFASWEGSWHLGSDFLKSKLPDYTIAQRREILERLRLTCPVKPESDPRYIAFKNGVLDINTMRMEPMSQKYVIPSIIPHEYNADAKDQSMWEALNAWADDDIDTLHAIGEIVGMCMYRSTKFGVAPILRGEACNGKSTFFRVLQDLLGEGNYTAFALDQCTHEYYAAQLIGKLANFGDDIPGNFLKDDQESRFKTLVTGGELAAREPTKQPTSFRPTTTLVFACNDYPKFKDRSEGIYRRLMPVEFRHVFTADNDINVVEKLTTESAIETLIQFGIDCLADAVATGKLHKSHEQEARIREIKETSSSVVSFLCDEYGLWTDGQRSVAGKRTMELYQEYRRYCDDNGLVAVASRFFVPEVARNCEVRKGRKVVAGGATITIFKDAV